MYRSYYCLPQLVKSLRASAATFREKLQTWRIIEVYYNSMWRLDDDRILDRILYYASYTMETTNEWASDGLGNSGHGQIIHIISAQESQAFSVGSIFKMVYICVCIVIDIGKIFNVNHWQTAIGLYSVVFCVTKSRFVLISVTTLVRYM